MKVFTHYPALALAIRRAGFEPVLEEPIHRESGPVEHEVTTMHGVTLLEVRGRGGPLYFEKLIEQHAWGLVR